jgi:serine protease AprX
VTIASSRTVRRHGLLKPVAQALPWSDDSASITTRSIGGRCVMARTSSTTAGRGTRLRLVLVSVGIGVISVSAMVTPVQAGDGSKTTKTAAADTTTTDATTPPTTTTVPASQTAGASALGSMYSVVDQVGARALWERGITGDGVNVAVIDTGVAAVDALSDPDKVVAMVDLSTEAGVREATFVDTYGHGTHIAGIIAGRDPGADTATARAHPEWFLGVAPDAGLVSVKVGDNSGAVDVTQVIAGVDWVTDHAEELDIRVINLSYSSGSELPYWSDPLTYAVERAWRAGIVVVVAAGNDGMGQMRIGVPANDPFVLAVGGVEAMGGGTFAIPTWATNGNGLRNPDVGAPGAHIVSLRAPLSRIDLEHPEGREPDGRLFRGSGSSQAAAVTSGAVALMLDADPRLTPDQVKAALRASADASVLPPFSSYFAGKGVVRVDRAVDVPRTSRVQSFTPSTGTGLIEKARGDVHIVINGTPLSGEFTVIGSAWDGTRWPDRRWSGGVWDGTRWSAGDWMGTRWSDATWTGAAWMGSAWTGTRWSGTRWSDAAWTSGSWTGTRWSGTRWSDDSWSGAVWDGTRWSGTRWSGTRWSSVPAE